jgi:hypothetical protein
MMTKGDLLAMMKEDFLVSAPHIYRQRIVGLPIFGRPHRRLQPSCRVQGTAQAISD